MKAGLLFAAIILAISCSTTRYMAADVSPEEAEIVRFETISRISLVEKGDRMMRHDSLSTHAGECLDRIISGRCPFALLPEEKYFTDTVEIKLIEEDLAELASTFEGLSKRARAMPIDVPRRVDSIMSSHGVRRAMLTLHTGFTRTGGNMGGARSRRA